MNDGNDDLPEGQKLEAEMSGDTPYKELLERGEASDRRLGHDPEVALRHRRREEDPVKFWEKGINRIAAALTAASIIVSGIGLNMFFNNPFFMDAEAAELEAELKAADAQLQAQVNVNIKGLTEVNQRLDGIELNTQITAQNVLEEKLSRIKSSLKEQSLSETTRESLRDSCRTTTQQLQRVEFQLQVPQTAMNCR